MKNSLSYLTPFFSLKNLRPFLWWKKERDKAAFLIIVFRQQKRHLIIRHWLAIKNSLTQPSYETNFEYKFLTESICVNAVLSLVLLFLLQLEFWPREGIGRNIYFVVIQIFLNSSSFVMLTGIFESVDIIFSIFEIKMTRYGILNWFQDRLAGGLQLELFSVFFDQDEQAFFKFSATQFINYAALQLHLQKRRG